MPMTCIFLTRNMQMFCINLCCSKMLRSAPRRPCYLFFEANIVVTSGSVSLASLVHLIRLCLGRDQPQCLGTFFFFCRFACVWIWPGVPSLICRQPLFPIQQFVWRITPQIGNNVGQDPSSFVSMRVVVRMLPQKQSSMSGTVLPLFYILFYASEVNLVSG